MKTIQDQVPKSVQKALNHTFSVFAPDSDTAQSMETLSRQWKYSLMNFSSTKDVGELSSKVLYADAGEREALDFDVIEVPAEHDKNGELLHSEYLVLSFKVANLDDGEGGGRKVARQGPKKCALANKFARKRISSNSTVPVFTCRQVSTEFHSGDFALLATRVSLANKLIVRFLFLGHSSLATAGRDSSFVDQHIQAGQDMFAHSQEKLNKLVVGANNGIEETKEAVMGDETAHLKRRISSDSNLSAAMMDNL
jgi:hypothetical protein